MLCSCCGLCSLRNRKSTLFGGKGEESFQDAGKLHFTVKCLNTFVAHCRFDAARNAMVNSRMHYR